MAAYWASRHLSTVYSPNYLVFGRENQTPIDLVVGGNLGEDQHEPSPDDYVEGLRERIRQAHDLAREHLFSFYHLY